MRKPGIHILRVLRNTALIALMLTTGIREVELCARTLRPDRLSVRAVEYVLVPHYIEGADGVCEAARSKAQLCAARV
jgi:hypothetical protein